MPDRRLRGRGVRLHARARAVDQRTGFSHELARFRVGAVEGQYFFGRRDDAFGVPGERRVAALVDRERNRPLLDHTLPFFAFDRADFLEQRVRASVVRVDPQRAPRQLGAFCQMAFVDAGARFRDELFDLLLIESVSRPLHQRRSVRVLRADQDHLFTRVEGLDETAGIERLMRRLEERLDPLGPPLLENESIGPGRKRGAGVADDGAFIEGRRPRGRASIAGARCACPLPPWSGSAARDPSR